MSKKMNQQGNVIFYTTPKQQIRVEVHFEDETFWLTQKRMAELFGVESNTITYHLKEIFASGELDENSTTRKIRAVQQEGQRQVARTLDFYNLDAIIAVGYRVNSAEATQFRIRDLLLATLRSLPSACWQNTIFSVLMKSWLIG